VGNQFWAHAMRPYGYLMIVVGFTRIAVKKINLGSILVNVAGFVDYLDRFASDKDYSEYILELPLNLFHLELLIRNSFFAK
jgi:hypothetical protein